MSKSITEWVEVAHRNAVEHGWWPELVGTDSTVNNILAKIALMHSELSEALEEVREGRMVLHRPGSVMKTVTADGHRETVVEGKPEGAVVELADCVIRIFDLCGALGLDLEGAIEAKHAYNATRPFRHGGKKA